MGHMAKGVYHVEDDVSRTMPSGEWERQKSTVRNWITPDGAPGPTGEGGFAAEAGRYHLYVAWNCPWAHRSLLARVFKTLDALITVSAARPNRTEQGWVYDEAGEFSDPLMGIAALHEVYAADPAPYTGRVTVPVLWDKLRGTIVNNESAEIVRMFDRAFDHLAPEHGNPGLILCPDTLRDEIDAVNADVYDRINNGVYKAGFATTQDAYEAAVVPLFEALDRMEARLADGQGWLVGGRMTEADLRLFTTLVRFDPVYHGHFKCNLRRIADYPMLTALTARLLAVPAIRETVDDAHIRWHYYWSHTTINPTRVVPLGPAEPPRLDPSWPAPALD